MWISRVVCLFIIYSFFGWVYESVLCVVTKHKWVDRGFLYGPICPIYGVGVVSMMLFLAYSDAHSLVWEPWQIFIIAAVGTAVLEFATSWVLEKLFHAVWWDYSNLPFNLQGRISLFTSLGFGFAGLLVVYMIAPFTEKMFAPVSPLAAEFLALLSLSVFMVDLTLTVTALLHFDQMVIRADEQFQRNMEVLVDTTLQRTVQLKEGLTKRQKQMTERVNSFSGMVKGSMGSLMKGTVRRVHSFRDNNTKNEDLRNGFLRFIQDLPAGARKKSDGASKTGSKMNPAGTSLAGSEKEPISNSPAGSEKNQEAISLKEGENSSKNHIPTKSRKKKAGKKKHGRR